MVDMTDMTVMAMIMITADNSCLFIINSKTGVLKQVQHPGFVVSALEPGEILTFSVTSLFLSTLKTALVLFIGMAEWNNSISLQINNQTQLFSCYYYSLKVLRIK